jgi:hypothetical protein
MHAYLKRAHGATPLAHICVNSPAAASALHCLGPQGLNNVRKVYAYMARVRGAMYVSIYIYIYIYIDIYIYIYIYTYTYTYTQT